MFLYYILYYINYIILYYITFCYFNYLKEYYITSSPFFFSARVNTYDCGEKISSWLSKFFGRPCHLIKQSSDFQRNARKKRGKGITFRIAS